MRKKPEISQVDLDAFYAATSGTRPLRQSKIRLTSRKKPPINPSPLPTSSPFTLTDSHHIPAVAAEESLQHYDLSISDKMLSKLRKGQYNVEATLDLHGMSIEKARVAVSHFLARNLALEKRVVLIIHGKGQHSDVPILKNKINQWLRQVDCVLAFTSATPQHGSRGAVYVLLRRMTKEKVSE